MLTRLRNLINEKWSDKSHRLLLGVVLILTSAIIFLALYTRYGEKIGGFQDDIRRMIWFLPFMIAGLGIRSFAHQEGKGKPWFPYLCIYLPVCVSTGLILYVALHVFEATRGRLYYPAAAGGAFLIGFYPWTALHFLNRASQ